MVNVYEDNFDDSFAATKDLIMIVKKIKEKDGAIEKPKKK